MFGGGNGGFGVAQQNPFGASAQASPMNAFQGASGGSNSGFGNDATTAFGGRGRGGRYTSASTRGGRDSTRGGRVGGRSSSGRFTPDYNSGNLFGDPVPAFTGGWGRGRGGGEMGAPYTGGGRGRGHDTGAPYTGGGRGRGHDTGAPYTGGGRGRGHDTGAPYTGGGRGRGHDTGAPYTGGSRGQGHDTGAPYTSGRGRGRGATAMTASGIDVAHANPFAPPTASPSGFVGEYDATFSQPGRGGGRAGGRSSGGRTTSFGGGVGAVQPNIRRKSDFGGRGAKSQGTTFGQPGVNGFVPPLPPPLPESTPSPTTPFGRKSGRGGIVTPLSSSPIATSFGHQFKTSGNSQADLSGFPNNDVAGGDENPFTAPSSSPNVSAHTAFGRPQVSGAAFATPAAHPVREKRSSTSFPQPQAFQDGFQDTSSFETRLNGGRGRGKPTFMAHDDQADQGTMSTGRQPRRKTPTTEAPSTTFGDFGGGSASFAPEPRIVPTLKPKKKLLRAPPNGSPPITPAPGSPVSGTTSFIGDQRNKAELSSAQNLDGTCIDMCSLKERELHIRVDELSLFEKNFPGQPGMERELIVKRFQRSSADHKLDIPSELRPLGVLRSTQLYLEQQIMDREQLGPDTRFNPPRSPELIELYNFCWDRCRMIRKDFVLQNYRGAGGRVHPIAVDVHERIARYHILSEHELCEVPSFVAQQNMEQLGQTLKSLNELYDESRKLGDPAYLSPFEAECRGYFILCTIDNGRGSDVLKFVKGLAPQVREAPQVKFAMQVFVARHTQDYYTFFKLLREATYLQACLVFRWIPSMRSIALERMNRACRNQPYRLPDLVELLCFDDMDHAHAVCSQHGLAIGDSEEEPGVLVVNFGGEFETDLQLRQNKNPLSVHASHIYVSQKQGEFLRRDVVRGVTEYNQDEYPMLSKLIEDTEARERSLLYPGQPLVEDEYSAFAVFSSDPFALDHQAAPTHARSQSAPYSDRTAHPRALSSASDSEGQQHELDEIAKRAADIERTKVMMMQRIQQLEREKEAKKLQVKQVELAAKSEEQQRVDSKARAEAEALRLERDVAAKKVEEEEALEKKQLELEAELRRQAQARKVAAEQARIAELERIAEQKRRADEEQRRREMQRVEEERQRQAAIEAERLREIKRQADEARAIREAERRAELAREAAHRKQLQRTEKARLAVLKLKFYKWKKLVAQSKALPRRVRMDVSSLVDGTSSKPRHVVDWLFGGGRAASDVFGLKRRQWNARSFTSNGIIVPPETFWQPLDVAQIAGSALRESGHQGNGWKFVVADVLDEGLSSFGSWCAVKLGISSASLGEDERVSSIHTVQWSETSSIAVCCRYLDANFSRTLMPPIQQKKLSGTSGILLPLDLSHVLDPAKLMRWEERVCGMLNNLHPSSRVGLIVLGFCGTTTPRKGDALATAEAAIQRIRVKFEKRIAFVDGELVLEEEVVSGEVEGKIAHVIAKLATLCPKTESIQVADFSDLLDSVVSDVLGSHQHQHATEDVSELQSRLHAELWKLRDSLLSSSVIDIDAPIPELQATLGTPVYGWNSREAQQKRESVFQALTAHRITTDSGAQLPTTKVCEVYYDHIVKFVDSLFAVFATASAVAISTAELKRILFSLLVPFHEEFMRQKSDAVVPNAGRLLPWHQIFGQIYGAFIENLGESALYIPASMVSSSRPEKQVQRSLAPAQEMQLRKRSLDPSAQAAAVAFARRELKRALSDQLVDPEQAHGIKRLRHEIARDRAASQNFQQFLRRELEKC